MKTTILTTCMGRLSFLKQAVPTWIRHTPFDVLVVDYGCPDNSFAWADSVGPGVKGAFVNTIDVENGGQMRPQYFNRAKALSAGLMTLAQRGTDRVLIMDADTCLTSDLDDTGASDELRIVRPGQGKLELTGLIAVDLERARRVGLNTNMDGWGVDDIDFRLRLYFREQLKITFFPENLFVSLPHDDALRVANYEEKNREVAVQKNFRLMWDALSRLEFDRVLSGRDPNVDVLLGSASAKAS